MSYRIRVTEMITVPARELLDHAGNWAIHPAIQRDTLIGDMEEVGIVDALKAYRSARNGGALTIMDGHLRKAIDQDQLWPVLVLDLDDEEADKQLAFHNQIAGMIQIDHVKLQALLSSVSVRNAALRETANLMRERAREEIERARAAMARPAEEDWGDAFERLPDEDRAPFQQMTFTLHDSQVEQVKAALKAAGALGAYDSPNENSNGNALARICETFLTDYGNS